MNATKLLLFFTFVLLSGCTSIGGLTVRPAPSKEGGFTLKVCVLRDTNFSEQDVHKRFREWNEELGKYGITAVISGRIDILPRDGFTVFANSDQLKKIPLGRVGEPNCDRVAYFLGRNLGDFLYGVAALELPLPEVYGEVDDATSTRMCVVGKTVTFNHMLFGGAKEGIQHEGYHLLGCGHWSWNKCDAQIRLLKSLVASNPPAEDFVPSLTPEGRICLTRGETDEAYWGYKECPKLAEPATLTKR